MTERIKALTVVLERDIREDDAAPLIAAIKLMRGVAGVETHIADFDHLAARIQVLNEIRDDIVAVLNRR